MGYGALLTLAVATLLAGCASTTSAWHRDGATQEMTSADIAQCQASAKQSGYAMGAADDYLQRCMEAKGYRPSY